jgi:hypothetical protein
MKSRSADDGFGFSAYLRTSPRFSNSPRQPPGKFKFSHNITFQPSLMFSGGPSAESSLPLPPFI